VKTAPRHEIYHLSSGTQSKTALEVASALLSENAGRSAPRFVPGAERAFAGLVDRLASLPSGRAARGPGGRALGQAALLGSLFKVFLPYITYDTVFDNQRVCEELGAAPVPFTAYCGGLYTWARAQRFSFPYSPLPPGLDLEPSPRGADA